LGLALRLIGFLVVVAIGASIVTYFITQNRAYLRFAWQVGKYSVILALVGLAFLAFERIVLGIL